MQVKKRWRQIRIFVRAWWRIAAPYWKTKESRKTALYLTLAMVCDLAGIYLTVRFANWSRDFFNAMQDKNMDEFFHQLAVLMVLASASLLMYANQRYLCRYAVLRWRQWLSADYAARWLNTRCYYREIFAHQIDNPDQRIAEDLQLFPSRTITMIFDFVDSIGSFGAFTVILWQLSLSYPFFGLQIPGILFWLAVLFVIIGTTLVHWIGRPLVHLERESQRTEANYRYQLLRVRERAREIAVLGGERWELKQLAGKFGDVVDVWLKTIIKERHLHYFMSGYSQISSVVPYLMAAPKYFTGAFGMGELMQTVQSFNGVRASLSWFIVNYETLTGWKATVDRLTQ